MMMDIVMTPGPWYCSANGVGEVVMVVVLEMT